MRAFGGQGAGLPSATKGDFWKNPPWNPKNFWKIFWLTLSLQRLFRADCNGLLGPLPQKKAPKDNAL
jgi:hypothetical protein